MKVIKVRKNNGGFGQMEASLLLLVMFIFMIVGLSLYTHQDGDIKKTPVSVINQDKNPDVITYDEYSLIPLDIKGKWFQEKKWEDVLEYGKKTEKKDINISVYFSIIPKGMGPLLWREEVLIPKEEGTFERISKTLWVPNVKKIHALVIH